MNRTPKSWKRDTTWKYGNRPPLDVDPLHVELPDFGVQQSRRGPAVEGSPLGWALVALVVVGVVLLVIREVLT